MALDVCIETYGSVAPLVSTDSLGAVLRLGALPRSRRRQTQPSAPDRTSSTAILVAADTLPFVLAYTLWLVDICGCTYHKAAVEMSTTPDVVERRIASARQAIRVEILKEPPDRA